MNPFSALRSQIRPGEGRIVAWSALYFFSLLCGYYVLRPVRDEMGIQAGVGNLPWLFSATFVVMLAAVPLFGWVSALLPRRTFLPGVYVFFVATLLAFHFLFLQRIEVAVVARAFFVWLSVFNLFVVSVFWSFMADLFSHEQARRLFGFISAGGSAGALAGPALTAALAQSLGPANLLPVSAGFLLLAVVCIARLGRLTASAERDAAGPLGGSVWAGLATLTRSPYLLTIAGYILVNTLLGTLLYFQQQGIVAQAYSDAGERTRLFALLDLSVNVLSLAGQTLVISAILRRLGMTFALLLLPLVSVAGFAILGAWPTLAALIAFAVVRRATEYALSKPAREVLFTLVSREEKYKAKNVLDTVVARGGDAVSGWIAQGFKAAGMALAGVSAVAVPVCLAWCGLALVLGRLHGKRVMNGDSP
jgi:AAA family ATP:ADP antiporter